MDAHQAWLEAPYQAQFSDFKCEECGEDVWDYDPRPDECGYTKSCLCEFCLED